MILKSLKLFFYLIYTLLTLIFIAIATLFLLIENLNYLDEYIKEGARDFNLTYSSLDGGLFRGLRVSNLNYQDSISLESIYLNLELAPLLFENRVSIKALEFESLRVKEEFIQNSLKPKESKDSNSSSVDIPLEAIEVEDFKLSILDLKYQEYILNHLELNSKDIEFKFEDMSLRLSSHLRANSNIVTLESNSTLNGDRYSSNLELKLPKDSLIYSYVPSEVDLSNLDKIDIDLSGDFKNLRADIELFADELYRDNLNLKPLKFNSNVELDLENQDLKVELNSKFDSNISKIDLIANANLNLKDINKSLKYSSNLKLTQFKDLNRGYISKFFQDERVNLDSIDFLEIDSIGDLKEVNSKVNLKSDSVIYRDFNISLDELNSNIDFNILTQNIKISNLNSTIDSIFGDISLNIESIFLNPKDINSTEIQAVVTLNSLNRFNDIKLLELDNSKLNLSGDLKSFNFQIESKLFEIVGELNSFKNLSLKLKSQRVYPNRFKELKELESAFVKFNLDSKIDLETLRGVCNFELLEAKVLDRELKSNNFKIEIDNQDIILRDLKLYIDREFELLLSAIKQDNLVDLKVLNSAFELNSDIEIGEIFRVDSTAKIDSISKFQSEVKKLFEFKKAPVDGAIELSSSLEGKSIALNLKSDRVSLENSGDIESILLDIDYSKEALRVRNFDFKLANFRDRNLNREFNLSKSAEVKFEDESIYIQNFNFNEILTLNGEKIGEDINLFLDINNLYLSKDGYGEGKVDSSLEFYRYSGENFLIGDIYLSNVNIDYIPEGSLSIERDSDIVIVEPNSTKKSSVESSSFKRDFFIDLYIQNRDSMRYFSQNGNIYFDVKLEILKELNRDIQPLGRVEIERGYYNFEGKRFEILESEVLLGGGEDINPTLNINLKYVENQVEIFITIYGDLKNPKLKFSSNPFMVKKDIISFLLFGKSSDKLLESNNGNSQSVDYSKKAMIFLGNSISKDVADALGLEIDKIDITQDDDTQDVSVEIGKRVSDDIMVNYRNRGSQNSIVIEYELDRNLGVESEVAPESNSIELFYKRDY